MTPRQGGGELRLIDLARGGNPRLSIGDFPVWTPDGDTLTAGNAPGRGLSLIPVSRPSNITHFEGTDVTVPGSWSADGRLFVFYRIDSDTNRDIWVMSRDGDAEPFLVTPANERTPYFSPDGHWIVYVSDESGRTE